MSKLSKHYVLAWVHLEKVSTVYDMSDETLSAAADVCAISSRRCPAVFRWSSLLRNRASSQIRFFFFLWWIYIFHLSRVEDALLGSTRSLPPFPVGPNGFQVRGVPPALAWECLLKLFSYWFSWFDTHQIWQSKDLMFGVILQGKHKWVIWPCRGNVTLLKHRPLKPEMGRRWEGGAFGFHYLFFALKKR